MSSCTGSAAPRTPELRVLTLNVNGIRSAASKGFLEWMRRQRPDFVCLQEIRAFPEQMPLRARRPRGYHAYFMPAERKGYSGVGIYSRVPADRVVRGIGYRPCDAEGRWLQIDVGDLSVVSFYMPSGSTPGRQPRKFRFMKRLMTHLRQLGRDGRSYVVCGDWNLAHKPIDLTNWRSNQKHSGFLPEERAWLDRLFLRAGFVDTFRVVDDNPERYTWWSNRGQAWAKNVGWRLDYQITTPDLASRARTASIYTRRRFSDHAPLVMDYDDIDR